MNPPPPQKRGGGEGGGHVLRAGGARPMRDAVIILKTGAKSSPWVSVRRCRHCYRGCHPVCPFAANSEQPHSSSTFTDLLLGILIPRLWYMYLGIDAAFWRRCVRVDTYMQVPLLSPTRRRCKSEREKKKKGGGGGGRI